MTLTERLEETHLKKPTKYGKERLNPNKYGKERLDSNKLFNVRRYSIKSNSLRDAEKVNIQEEALADI